MSPERSLHVLLISSEWPTAEHPEWATFVVQQVTFLKRAGVKVDVFPFQGRGSPASYLKAWREVRARLRAAPYDLIHAHFGNSALLALPRRLPLVLTLWGSDVQGIVGPGGRYTLKGVLLRQITRMAARAADQVIVVAERLIRFLPARDYHVIPGGIDLDLFKPVPRHEARQALGLPDEQPIVFFAANPGTPVKRFGLARAAVDALRADMPDVQLLTAGGIPFTQMPLYMNAADVLLVTSRHEGSPTVVKEALACNLPVVSVDVGDVRQRIAGVAGCVVCKDDRPETIAAALRQVLAERARTNGREAAQWLDEKLMAEEIIAVYWQAVERNA